MASASSTLVVSVFMARLLDSELYGKPQDGLADRLKERAPEGLTEAGLTSAAEQIIRRRGSGAFPKFPECMTAIEENLRPKSFDKGAATSSDPVTRENFAERIDAFLKAGGRPWKLERSNDEMWMQWRTFYNRIGAVKIVALMDEFGRENWTTPGEKPSDFDRTYATPIRLDYPDIPVEVQPEQRIEILQRFCHLIDTLESRFPTKKRHKMNHREVMSLDELVDDFKSAPLVLSPALSDKLGLTR